MSVLSSLPALRWLAPAAAATAVIGGGAAVGTISAGASPDLPPRNAAQLLVDVQTARLDGLSGTVVQRADLGLPSIPGVGGATSSDLTALITGKHTLRVWYAGPDQARVALLGTLGESDIILNKTDLWVWSSQDNTASHSKLSADAEAKQKQDSMLSGTPLTPQQAADEALSAIDPSTVVSTAGSAKVAGRNAYELVLAPRDSASRVDQIRIAIDATEHVPLRVQLFAKGSADPAFEVAFTKVSFTRPDAGQFVFNPPPGAKVTEGDPLKSGKATTGTGLDNGKTAVIGKAWTAVVVGQASQSDLTQNGGQLSGVLDNLPRVSGSWGSGRLLSSKVFSVLLTDDGRVLAGLVAPERLYQAAMDPAAVALKTK